MKIELISLALVLTACGSNPSTLGTDQLGATPTPSPTPTVLTSTATSARFIFNMNNFTNLTDFLVPIQTNYQCLGDVINTFSTNGADYVGSPTAFPSADLSDALNPTTRPTFIKNVSVDMTNAYFQDTVPGTLQSDACSYQNLFGAPSPVPCADFDFQQTATPAPTIVPTPTPTPSPTPTPDPSATPTATPIPSPTVEPSPTPYYGLQYYRAVDDWCSGQGPILSADVNVSKTNIGGVNIDLDRTQLGDSEDLLMLITYQAYNENASWPAPMGSNDQTILQVNLIGTGLQLSLLIGEKQPRPWSDFASASMPIYMKQIATLEDPWGSLRTDQVYIPLSGNPLIDRIRVERIRGSYHLFQIDLYRLGNRASQ